MRTVYLNAAYFPAVELLSAVATAVILLYGGNQVLDGDSVTIGVLASFVFYLQSFFDPIQQLSQLYTTYQAGMAALDKIFELLDEEPDLGDRPDARRAAAACAARSSSTTCRFSYGGGRRRALCDVDLHVPPGQTVALVGATGAGQVDARQAGGALLRPRPRARAGRRPRPARRDRAARCARSSGIVPQEGFLFSGTIRDNIALRPPGRRPTRTCAAAARAVGAARVHRAAARRLRHRGRRARRPPVGRASASWSRSRARRRPTRAS